VQVDWVDEDGLGGGIGIGGKETMEAEVPSVCHKPPQNQNTLKSLGLKNAKKNDILR